jgi:hypothetical protein
MIRLWKVEIGISINNSTRNCCFFSYTSTKWYKINVLSCQQQAKASYWGERHTLKICYLANQSNYRWEYIKDHYHIQTIISSLWATHAWHLIDCYHNRLNQSWNAAWHSASCMVGYVLSLIQKVLPGRLRREGKYRLNKWTQQQKMK